MPERTFRAQDFSAVIFDLDGVVTKTARVHAAAWKRLFDAFLQERAARQGEEFKPFSPADYLRYLDGKPRYDGVRSFLASRGIDLPAGSPEDPPDRETVCGLGNRKNDYFHLALEEQGVEVYPGTIGFIGQLKAQGDPHGDHLRQQKLRLGSGKSRGWRALRGKSRWPRCRRPEAAGEAGTRRFPGGGASARRPAGALRHHRGRARRRAGRRGRRLRLCHRGGSRRPGSRAAAGRRRSGGRRSGGPAPPPEGES